VDAYGREKMRIDVARLQKSGLKNRRNATAAKQQGVNNLVADETSNVEQMHKFLEKRNVSERASLSNFEKSLKFFNHNVMIELLQDKLKKKNSGDIRNEEEEEAQKFAKYMVQNHGGCPLLGALQNT